MSPLHTIIREVEARGAKLDRTLAKLRRPIEPTARRNARYGAPTALRGQVAQLLIWAGWYRSRAAVMRKQDGWGEEPIQRNVQEARKRLAQARELLAQEHAADRRAA